MTAIDSTHAALLRGIARNTNDDTAKKVYADWLMEQGNPGWVIVLNYRIQDWPIACTRAGETKKGRTRYYSHDHWKLPWLDGVVPNPRGPNAWSPVTDPRSRIKQILNLYADGEAITDGKTD